MSRYPNEYIYIGYVVVCRRVGYKISRQFIEVNNSYTFRKLNLEKQDSYD